MHDLEKLLDLLERSEKSDDPALDITKARPDLTLDEVYRLQLALKRRKEAAGDPFVGYRISQSSLVGNQEAVAVGLVPEDRKGIISPVFASLSLSNIGRESDVVEIAPDRHGYIEGEVGVLIANDIKYPHISPPEIINCIAGFFPAIDLAQIPKTRIFSSFHVRASMARPADTTIIVGPTSRTPHIDMRLEGMLVSVNGEVRSSGTAWESLGGPLNALAWLATQLVRQDECLKAGQVVICGVCAYPQRLVPGDCTARVEFTRLGGVSTRVDVPS